MRRIFICGVRRWRQCCAGTECPCCVIGTRTLALPVRRPVPRRYERAAPGDLGHRDVKKLGRIPDGGGHRKVGRRRGPDGLHGRVEHPVI